MALTMTRTRTQTALSKMATLLANLNGELEFVRELLLTNHEHYEVLVSRERVLAGRRAALYATLKHFDSTICPDAIGAADSWRFGTRREPFPRSVQRYLAHLSQSQSRQ